VQTFFARRVHSLSANPYLGVLVYVLVLVQFGFGAATCVKAVTLLEFEAIVKEWRWFAAVWLIIQTIADIVITTCMCLLLRHRRTGFQKTDSVINRMVLYTISTGLATSVLSCVILAIFAKYGFNFGVFAIGMPLGGFYSVTMLANLNMRKRHQARLDTPSLLELISSSIKKRLAWNRGDHGSEEWSPGAREVVRNDVNINPMPRQISDTKVRFTGVQSPV